MASSYKQSQVDQKGTKHCIIHHENSTDKLTENLRLLDRKNSTSWEALLNAATRRKHAPILEIAKTLKQDEIPEIYYHGNCRSRFTMKRDIEQLSDEKTSADGASTSRKSLRRSTSASSSRVYDDLCLFCDKKYKYKRDNTKEITIQCCDMRADDRIRAEAISRNDDKVLAIVSRELVAAEAHYHRSCYKDYTRATSSTVDTDNIEVIDEAEITYKRIEKEALQHVFNFIREKLFVKPHIILMTDLALLMSEYMELNGDVNIQSESKKSLKRKLIVEFGSSLHFVADTSGKLLIYPDNLTVEDIVRENQRLEKELTNLKGSTSGNDKIIVKAALSIRSDIKDHTVNISWPPKPEELAANSVVLPSSVKQFLQVLLSGDKTKDKDLSTRNECLINSIGQDFIYAVSKQKTQKHILLPYAVKSLTGNVEVIKILNRLGHSVSLSAKEEIDTALCLQKLAITSEGKVALPENLQNHVITMLAYDNIDRLEETLSGKGTSHRVNGIAVQPAVYGPQPEKPVLPSIAKSKQRSIEIVNDKLPIYNAGKRPNPPIKEVPNFQVGNEIKYAQQKNLIWAMCRNIDRGNQIVNAWTGFNIKIRNEHCPVQDRLCYLPSVNAPATELSTVYEVICQAIEVMKLLKLTKIGLTMDQCLYAKACEVVWKHSDKFKAVILRMGIFHTIGVLEAIIGIRFEDAGLRDLCIEAEIVADGSITRVMSGKMYNRATRAHKLMYEALLKLLWDCFIPWFDDNYQPERHRLDSVLETIRELRDDVCQGAFEIVYDCPNMNFVADKFNEFIGYQQNQGNLSAFWLSYIELVEILLALLRSTREGDWALHMWAIKEMIPWCFSYDRLNYARYMSVYYRDMTNLERDHPDVYDHFMAGGFSVQLSSNNPFGRVPMDQATEETVNKDTQTPGGTKGFSLKPSAVSRYYLTAEFRSIFLREMRDMVNLNEQKAVTHADLQTKRTKRDEADVMKLVDLMEHSWVNPFNQESQDLVSLSTATVASVSITNDLLAARDIGLKASNEFNKRLTGACDKIFHDTLPKQKLKTFSHLTKKTKSVKCGPKEVILKADRTLFAHMIILAQNRKLSMREVLSHPLGPLPWSLATTEGMPRKTNKSALARVLEKKVSPADVIPNPSACIIDGMALVQKINGDHRTFGDVANTIFSNALRESNGYNSSRLDIVFDVYNDQSIKNAERMRRSSASETIQYKNIAAGQIIQQWRKFLSNGCNKTQLILFLVKHWKQADYQLRNRLEEKVLFVTYEEKCMKITKDDTEDVQDLYSSQEEADTRLLLHAKHASNAGYPNIVIVSEDTDVFLLCLFYSSAINASIFVKCGTQCRMRYIDISKLALACGETLCKTIIGLHTFTGCDSISSFAGKGKLSALKMLTANNDFVCNFTDLGSSSIVSEELFLGLERFVCAMYSSKSDTGDVNELRYKLFFAKKGEIESHQLPPCRDCLRKHTQRANYQTLIWKQSLVNNPDIPNPSGNGWIEEDAVLKIDWMDGNPAPDAVLQFLSCTCARSCTVGKCVCIANGLGCTDMCKLQTCENQATVEEEEDINFSDSDSEELSDDMDD